MLIIADGIIIIMAGIFVFGIAIIIQMIHEGDL